MVLALAFVLPTLCGQIFTPSEPLLQANRRAVLLVVASVALQLLAGPYGQLAYLLVPASFAGGTIALTWIVWTSGQNRPSTALAAVGGLANLVPIAAYGAMPVRRASRESFTSHALDEPSIISAKHAEFAMPVGLENPISLLVDWIPLPALQAVISVGDIAIVAALIWLGIAKALVAGRQPTP